MQTYYFTCYVVFTHFMQVYGQGAKLPNVTEWRNYKQCGETRYDDGKGKKLLDLEGGKAQMGRFPWMVKLGAPNIETKKIHYYCTGSLISEYFVVSAAHCATFSKVPKLGENNEDQEVNCTKCVYPPRPQTIIIEKHFYANHCRLSRMNDIILIKLLQPVKFNGNVFCSSADIKRHPVLKIASYSAHWWRIYWNIEIVREFVQPICILNIPPPFDTLEKKPVIIPGWGVAYSGFGGVYVDEYIKPRDLKFIETKVLDPEECNKVYEQKIEDNQYCVEYRREDGACVVDSGGPLVMFRKMKESGAKKRAYLLGIASHDIGCDAGNNRPVIYTNVANFSLWIATMSHAALMLSKKP